MYLDLKLLTSISLPPLLQHRLLLFQFLLLQLQSAPLVPLCLQNFLESLNVHTVDIFHNLLSVLHFFSVLFCMLVWFGLG